MMAGAMGRFVCVEGIDGAGKTLIAGEVVARLRAEGVNAALVSRDSVAADEGAAKRLRILTELLWGYDARDAIQRLGHRHLILLMASWFDLFHRWIVAPALAGHQVTVTDQSPCKYIARFHALGRTCADGLFDQLIAPDLVLLLGVDPALAASRKPGLKPTECGTEARNDLAAFIAFQSAVAERLRRLRNPAWREIDASAPAAIVATSAVEAVRSIIGPGTS
ncbi:MAG: hypothetical protein HQL39_12805 [Alphaproteobacteria bacterium]|nr:hypothetical protein [Alphaproteobacteria bacterium]MBF0374280.1 hypothetical protein [Alphaproteobacteria bacterium]